MHLQKYKMKSCVGWSTATHARDFFWGGRAPIGSSGGGALVGVAPSLRNQARRRRGFHPKTSWALGDGRRGKKASDWLCEATVECQSDLERCAQVIGTDIASRRGQVCADPEPNFLRAYLAPPFTRAFKTMIAAKSQSSVGRRERLFELTPRSLQITVPDGDLGELIELNLSFGLMLNGVFHNSRSHARLTFLLSAAERS